jgi:nitrogen-specific signal transduction histidine kinase/CheY-like chemotaxis protein
MRGRDDGWIFVARDLTERHRLEAELVRAQKMEAIGRLAGGIAHDFNNMLSIILGYSVLLLDGLAPDDPRAADIGEIKRAGERSADLTRQLLAFSRQQVLETKIVDLNEIVESTSRMVRRVLGEDVEQEIVLSLRASRVKVAPGQVEQVIMNLVVNARDAMPNGGRLTVETRQVEFDSAADVKPDGVHPGRYAVLEVTDTGVGMDAATQQRIFEPFFTTKEQGKGTGLGLSTVFGIVHQGGGRIRVDSEPGRGTKFTVYLPEERGASEAADRAPASPRPGRGNETVLVVEDEDQVRALVQAILQRQGYRVLAAQHPTEAIRLSAQFDGKIDLLLTDVIMPEMSGRLLADQLLASRPDAKVLFMSGYTNNVVLDRGAEGTHMAFLQKPVTPSELHDKVRAVLDAQSEGRPS